MMTMFRGYQGDTGLVVAEDGTTIQVPGELITAAGFAALRPGQRLVLVLNELGDPESVRVP